MAKSKERDKICEECKKEFDGDKVVGCEGICASWFHLECSGLTSKQYHILENCSALKWLCKMCLTVDSNSRLNKTAETSSCSDYLVVSEKELRIIVQNAVKEAVMALKEEIKVSKQDLTYAEKIKTGKSYADAVLLVKPVNEQKAEITKREIKKNISLEDMAIGVSKLKQVSGGGVIIGCDSRSDIDKLKGEIIEKMGKQYKVDIPKQLRPKIKITGIYLMEIEDKDEVIIDKICKQNTLNTEEGFYMKLLRKVENKRTKAVDLYLEVDKLTHSAMLKQGMIKLGWSRGKAVDHIYVKRCFKCWGFNHTGSNCKSNIICPNCAGNHTSLQCTDMNIQCNNCLSANKKYNLQLRVNHKVTDRECPSYLRIYELLKRRTNYEL